eukprot:scaffold65046_cov67-Phaeocystis_antarctica.AAC.2
MLQRSAESGAAVETLIIDKRTVIGRAPLCDVRIEHPQISARHCMLLAADALGEAASSNRISPGRAFTVARVLMAGRVVLRNVPERQAARKERAGRAASRRQRHL